MKKCIKCGIEKDESDFYKYGSLKDGLYVYCKVCQREKVLKFNHSERGVITNMYKEQKRSSNKRKHNQPTYTKGELKEWLYNNNFKEIYDVWVGSNYDKMLIPSCDRLDNSKGYSFNNIELVTWMENKQRCHNDVKHGKVKSTSRYVNQYSKNGVLINTFHSISEASRQTNVGRARISACCGDKYKGTLTGGYIWEYSNNERSR